MKLVLQHDVDDLGFAGDIVNVKPGYARNYLLPRRFAVPATTNNMRRVEKLKKETEKRHTELESTAKSLATRLASTEVVIRRKTGDENKLYGSVTTSDIAHALADMGFSIERRKIHLGEPIKMLGEHVVFIKLFKDVKAEVKVKVEQETA